MTIGLWSRAGNRPFAMLLLGWAVFLAALAPSQGAGAQSAAHGLSYRHRWGTKPGWRCSCQKLAILG